MRTIRRLFEPIRNVNCVCCSFWWLFCMVVTQWWPLRRVNSPAVHPNPSKKTRSFSKTPFTETGGIYKRLLSVSYGQETVWKQSSIKTMTWKDKSKVTGDCPVLKFLEWSVDGNIWSVFKVKPPFSRPFSNSTGVVGVVLGSINSRCPGKEPALLPSPRGGTQTERTAENEPSVRVWSGP